MWGCNSPFQVKVVYTPKLVVYGIVFRGDSTVSIRVQTNSRFPIADPDSSKTLDSLSGYISAGSSSTQFPLRSIYRDGLNFLQGIVIANQDEVLSLIVGASGYPSCSATVTVLDSATIYIGDSQTDAELRDPTALVPPSNLNFLVYPSHHTKGIRATLAVVYEGKNESGAADSGEIVLDPTYQTNTTTYLFRNDGNPFHVYFAIRDYQTAYNEAVAKAIGSGGEVDAVVRITQLDAALYDFYSTANGFNDPTTLRTERPIYTNVDGGDGFFGSASDDSLLIPVYP